MFEEFAKNIMAANGSGGDIYRNYNAVKYNASPASVAGKKAGAQADIDEINRRNSLEEKNARESIEKKEKDDAADPSKASMKLKPDGKGYLFYDGAGNMLNINQFSMLTGKRPDELLADSDDPRDQKFVDDYRTMKSISNAWVNGDNETLQKFRAADPEKFNQLVSRYKTPSDMVRAFTDYYSDYYGKTQGKQGNAARFSTGVVAGPGDSPQGKAIAKGLASSPLEQTLAPINTSQPRPLTGMERFNPFAGQRDALKRYEEEQKSNPWLKYYNYLRTP